MVGMRRLFGGAVLYPNLYVWFVLLAALDVMFTWVVLYLGGWEANKLAAWVIERGDLPGTVSFKFVLVILVVGVCEVVGRRKDRLGRRLAQWAVALTALPVVLALVQLLWSALFRSHV
jgi:hypothetical protein